MKNVREKYGKEGFSDVVIPETKVRTCCGCKYHDHAMIKSGMHPIYEDKCKHPDIYNIKTFTYAGQLSDIRVSGYIETPKWCPFLQTPKEEIKETTLNIAKENYDALLKSGMFWVFFPENTGKWEEDQERFLTYFKTTYGYKNITER